MITDSHTHLYWKSFDADRDEVLARAREAGVERMIVVGTDLETSEKAFALAREELFIYPSAGVHPHDAKDATPEVRQAIEALCRAPECVAVGETGLDYFKEWSPKARQIDSFHWQLSLAQQLDKPVIIHCRDAVGDTVAALREHPGVRGVMHCYTYGPDELDDFLELGLYVSFSGVVTYPKNEPNREAAKRVPDDRLLIETDCPFLSPQPKRGKRNEPAHVVSVLETVAEVRGEEPAALARLTSENAANLFGLDAR